ncbi:MAG TPA: MBL fold metallo-hydrolase, partial [Candidatus Limnocylindrales bacterium]|nr:MBL fold metallo-hydrolase [Candidatus Limnocylindrales bacterium]
LVSLGLRQPAVQDRLVRAALERMLADQPEHLFEEDALRVLLCGTGSPLPHATRAKPCVAVFAAGRFWVVDAGPGSWNRLALLRVDGSRIGGVLLTHFHSDHIGDLGEFGMNTWVMGRPGPLHVLGPPGVERVVAGFDEAYALDTQYRIAHHGTELLPADAGRLMARSIPGPASEGGSSLAIGEGGLRITAFLVDHDPVQPAYGYRFDWGGRSVVVSGDTTKHPGLVEAARGADVLVHEAQANHLVAMIGEAAEQAGRWRVAKIMADIPTYHTSPVEAAEIANEAGVAWLVLYHLTPPPPLRIFERIFARGVSEVRPEGWLLATDGLLLELPIGSSEVRKRRLE